MPYVLGIDFGTNSARSIVVRCSDGTEVGASVSSYGSGDRGIYTSPNDHNLARQHPKDYLESLKDCVRGALADAVQRERGFSGTAIVGIGVGTTGSSPIPVDRRNSPLALDSKWAGNLDAYCWLWKDHTSFVEASQITRIAKEIRPRYLSNCGDNYSSEWFWAKIWHCLNSAPEVFEAAYSWVELCDWIPSLLSGVADPKEIKRGVCAAGHKALYSSEWGGLPDQGFLERLDPRLGALRPRLYELAYDSSESAGFLSFAWAELFGLTPGIPIAIGELDVHYGAIGAGIGEGTLVKVIGTSSCDCALIRPDAEVPQVPGICGIVKGAILPGYYGVEAGQSAVGDLFDWFIRRICAEDDSAHGTLTDAASLLAPGESGLIALDWNNGNRNVLGDPSLSGLLVGQTLHTTRSDVYRALIEATAFGALKIIDRLSEYGIRVDRIVCAGGIAEKNPLLMQIYSDITGREMRLSSSKQTCALGAAVAAAVVAGPQNGGFESFEEAQRVMTSLDEVICRPNLIAHGIYSKIYELYKLLHDAFGDSSKSVDLVAVMKELSNLKASSVAGVRG